MSRPFKILTHTEADEFDQPPQFNAEQRKHHFYRSEGVQKLLNEQVRGDANRAHFVLSFGYFKAGKRFYTESRPRDRAYVARQFNLAVEDLDDANYHPKTRLAHQLLILDFFGRRRFDDTAKQWLADEIRLACRAQTPPKELFHQLVDVLTDKAWELPPYQTLAQLISTGLNQHKSTLMTVVDQHLSADDRAVIDGLLNKEEASNPDYARYKTTLLKRHSQSVRPQEIKENVKDLVTLKGLFQIAKPIMAKLDLSIEGIRHYANAVSKSEIFQIKRRSDPDRYLHMLAFITHRYFILQDTLIDVVLSAVTTARNSVEKEAKERYYNGRKTRQEMTRKLVEHAEDWQTLKQQIQVIIEDAELSAQEKVDRIAAIVNPDVVRQAQEREVIAGVRADINSTKNNAYIYTLLEENSKKLQNRVADIIVHTVFSAETYKPALLDALLDFQGCDGKIDDNAPYQFLTEHHQKILNDSGAFNIPLYKVFLFEETAQAIKSGALNIENSYRWRSFDQYQLPKKLWEENRDALIKQVGLEKFADFSTAMDGLGEELEDRWRITNTHIKDGQNYFVQPIGDGHFRINKHRDEADKEDAKAAPDIYPKDSLVSLSEVLYTVHRASGCLDSFEHWQHKYKKGRPDDSNFVAGVIGLGCNFGLERIAKSSRGQINKETLENTINHYFTTEHARNASKEILLFIDKMPLPRYLQDDPTTTRTSSDGSKYTVNVDSLNSNYSFKYGGHKRVLSEHSFIDEQNRFFHSDVIKGSEREAHYMIDGLLQNEVVQSDIHSTDTHGGTEAVFGSTLFIPTEFAPRIRQVNKETLYSLKVRSHYARLDYPILPDHKAQLDLIEPYWDDLLRMHVSMLLRESTPSQMYKRCNSYSRGENPVYDALKELGRLVKTRFVLKWLDDEDFRDAGNKQLNKQEASNKLARALMVGSPEYIDGLKDDQELAEACKRLLKNAIVCWNYLYLSQILENEKDPVKKNELIDEFRKISVAAWRHLSFHGEYDFSASTLRDSMGFRFDSLTDPKLLDFPKPTSIEDQDSPDDPPKKKK